jgi:hypothetical protein
MQMSQAHERPRLLVLDLLEIVAKSAKAKHLGLWGACPRTRYDPYHGIETRR